METMYKKVYGYVASCPKCHQMNFIPLDKYMTLETLYISALGNDYRTCKRLRCGACKDMVAIPDNCIREVSKIVEE